MNQFIQFIQYFGIVLLLFEMAFILYQPASFNQSMMLIFTAAALINTIGYLLEMKATSLELALYAVKFTYIGKPYIVLSMFLFALHFCKVRYPKILGIILFATHTGIVMSVMTCEYQTLFYTSIEFTNDGLFPHLILGHGILYYLYLGLIVLYSIIMSYFCIKHHQVVKTRSDKVQTIYLIQIMLIPLFSFIVYLSGITHGYDITAPSYILCATMLLICSLKYNFLNALRVAKDDVLDNLRDGILFINNDSELLFFQQQSC